MDISDGQAVTSNSTSLQAQIHQIKYWKMVIGVGEDVARRGFGLWEPYYRDYLDLLTSFPATQALVAESLIAGSNISRDLNVGPRIDRELRFELDAEADCVGPRYIALPRALAERESLPPLSDFPEMGTLKKENVMVRKERGAGPKSWALSVTLVGLNDWLANGNLPTERRGRIAAVGDKRIAPATGKGGDRSAAPRGGEYTLTFKDDASTVPIFKTSIFVSQKAR
jgi:hypothetical protein